MSSPYIIIYIVKISTQKFSQRGTLVFPASSVLPVHTRQGFIVIAE